MLKLQTERMGELAVIKCQGRIVRSEAAYKLREVVRSLETARIIVLDLSKVSVVEAGGLGMVVFLQQWAHDHDIRLKLFNPIRAVRERLKDAGPIPDFDFTSFPEMVALRAGAGNRFALAA
ncbi:MAG: STAS domain-containing protein [Acidobacteria bacterium]|nr:STAS domain-containing protein [Acidobacteriota bacterium]